MLAAPDAVVATGASGQKHPHAPTVPQRVLGTFEGGGHLFALAGASIVPVTPTSPTLPPP